MNHATITLRIAVAAALLIVSILAAGSTLAPIHQQQVYAASQSQFADQSTNTNSMTTSNMTPIIMPMGIPTTPTCPADTVFGLTTQAALPPGYNTLPVGTTLCMQRIGYQTITTITPTGDTLIMQVIASEPNQATCGAPSALALVSFGIPPTPAIKSLCVSLL